MTDSDRVIVVGAGPVGMITALALAREKVPVTVLDRLADIPTDHRASTLHPSTLAMLEPLGMTAEALERGLHSPHFQFRDRVTGDIVAEFDYALLADETPFPFALQLEQHKTIGIAEARARRFGCFELRRGHEALGLRQTPDGVEVEIRGPTEMSRGWPGAT